MILKRLFSTRKKVFLVVAFAVIAAAAFWYAISHRDGEVSSRMDTAVEETDDVTPDDYVIKEGNQEDLHPRGEPGVEEDFLIDDASKISGSVTVGPEDAEARIRDAADGSTIVLTNGKYAINLDIRDKTLTLVGSGPGTILVPKDPNHPVVSIIGGDVTIKNIVFSDGSIGMTAQRSKLTIEKVKWENFSATAVYAKESEVEADGLYVLRSGTGFKAVSSKGRIGHSLFRDNTGSGVRLIGSDFDVGQSDCLRNESYGIVADQDSTVRLDGNFIRENIGYDVRIEKERRIYR